MSKVKSLAVEEILVSEHRPMKHCLIFGVLIAMIDSTYRHDAQEWRVNLYHFVQRIFR